MQTDYHDECPTCGLDYIRTCRCPRADRVCTNGHSWHTCIVHWRVLPFASDHRLSGCSCEHDRIQTADDN